MTVQDAAGTRIPSGELASLEARLSELFAAGWRVLGETPTAIRLGRAGAGLVDGIAELDGLGTLFLDVRAVGHRGQYEIVAGLADDGTLQVRRLPPAAPEELFDDGLLDIAEAVWDDDPGGLARLPFTWEFTAELRLDRAVPPVDGLEIRVVLDPAAAEREVSACDVADVRRLVPPAGRRCYVALRGEREPLHLGAISFVSLRRFPPDGLVIPPRGRPLPGERARLPDLGGLPAPTDLLPLDEPGAASWTRLLDWSASVAAALTWIMAASGHRTDGTGTELTFVGYRPVRLNLPPAATLRGAGTAPVLRLGRWLLSDDSPDRLLAVRHVVSLHDGTGLPDAKDVEAGAQTIYSGLRSTAVAEAVTSRREAQSHARDAVRQAVKSTQDMLKVFVERFMAALVGVGGVVIGRATLVLDGDVSRSLMLAIACFLVILAAISVLIEGPIVQLPIRDLDTEIVNGYPLLGTGERDAIVDAESVAVTRGKVRTARIVIPAIYVLAALAIVVAGYPARYL